METRILKILTDEDIQKVQDTVSSWRTGDGYEDIEGYCKSTTTEEIQENDYVLTPGRYVGFAVELDDQVPFGDKINELSNILREQNKISKELDEKIQFNLSKLQNE